MGRMRSVILLVFLCISLSLAEDGDERDGKLLFATTMTSSTTVSTSAICYVASHVSSTAIYDKSMNTKPIQKEASNSALDLAPTKSKSIDTEAGDTEEAAMVESGKQELGLREAKFLYYWATFTETYTHFTTTSTWSLLSVACTPPNWTLNPCKGAANG